MFESMARFVQRVQYLRRTLLEPPAEPDLSPQNVRRIRALLSREDEAKAMRLVGEGRKIEAMRVVHDASGAGLAEAKVTVEAMSTGK